MNNIRMVTCQSLLKSDDGYLGTGHNLWSTSACLILHTGVLKGSHYRVYLQFQLPFLWPHYLLSSDISGNV